MINHFEKIPYLLLNVPEGVVFYVVGYQLRDIQYRKNILAASAFIFLIVTIVEPSFIGFRDDKTIQGYWMLAMVNSIAGIILFNNLFKLKFLQFPVLTSIGRNSMEYYCAHWILFQIVVIVFNYGDNVAANYEELMELLWASVIVLPCYQYWYKILKEKSTIK